MRPPSPQTSVCPRCHSQSGTPFSGQGGCLRCAGERALILDLDEFPPPEAMPESSAGSDLPGRVGPYEIVDEIGRGGMGRIFAARQPRLDRLVALKVLATGPAGAALEQRFLREIQTVARLRHPHIVAIHDSGRADGYVFFAMDYIEGGDLAHRLRERPLPPHAIAVLLEKIARALAYAHGEGVLHRDLKPSNILLDGDEPRLADFGLAAQIEAGGDLTVTSAILGTPHYLAPEAALTGSAALSPASDLYALGVILYEALAGRTPFAGASAAELPALLQNSEPPPLRLLAPATPRDLETICLKCLERDPARRYPAADALAEDLRRFLAGEPIVAQPPGWLERFGRFARRHRVALIATTITGTALVVATAVSTTLAVHARRAEKRASLQSAAAKAVIDFLKDDLLAKASLEEQPEPDLKVRTLLERTALTIDRRFAAQPEVESPIREVLGVTYISLGAYQRAHEHLVRALALARQQFGPDDLKTLAIENRLADTLVYLGKNTEAAHQKRRLWEIFRQRLGEDDRLTLVTACDLAVALTQAGTYTEAEPLLRQTIARGERALGPEDPATITALHALGVTLSGLGRRAESATVLTTALARARRTFGVERDLTLNCMTTLAGIHGRNGDLEKSVPLLEEAIPVARRVLGPDHPTTLRAMHQLAVVKISQSQLEAAADLITQVVDARRRVLGPEHAQTLQTETVLVACLFEQARFDEAAVLATAVVDKRARVVGPEHPDTLRSMEVLACAYAGQRKLDDATPLHTRVLALRKKTLGADHPDTLITWRNLGDDLLMQGNPAAAEATLREALAMHEKACPGTWMTATVQTRLGAALTRLGRLAEAEPLLWSAYEVLVKDQAHLPANGRKVFDEAASYLDEFFSAAGRPDEAASWRTRFAGKNAPR